MKKIINKQNFPVIIFVVFILAGILVMLYPSIANYINVYKSKVAINEYAVNVSNFDNKDSLKLIDEAKNYNSKLSGTTIVDVFSNPDSENTGSSSYLDILNINGNGIMGYIEIPKIDIKIPIYHGTSAKVLQKGVGHLEGSSFPVGGANTHAVLSGHRGLPSSRLFTDLDQLKDGDLFYINVLGQVLAYQVDQISVVEPSDVEKLGLQEGGDFVTLVTCTPYAINTHRLLVRGTRVEYKKEVLKTISVDSKMSVPDIIFYLGIFLAILIIIVVILISRKIKKDNMKRIREAKRNIEVI